MKYFLSKLSFLILGLIFGLLVFEVVLSLFNYSKNANKPVLLSGSIEIDPMLGWKHKPGQYAYADPSMQNSAFHVTYHQDGSRASSAILKHGLPKIAFFGCSFVEGYGLDDQHTFTWLLQEHLANYSIVNLGVGGYGTLHSLLILKQYLAEQGLSTQSKYIIYGFADFHPFRNIKNTSMQRYWESKGIFPYCDLESCSVWEGKPMLGQKLRHTRTFSILENIWDSLLVLPQREMAESLTIKLILEMKKIVEQSGAQFIVAPVNLNDQFWIDKFTEHGIEVFNCDSSELHQDKYRLKDGHPNYLWSQKFAECLKSKLIDIK